MSNMKQGTTGNLSFCPYIIEQEIWFVLVISSLPSKSAAVEKYETSCILYDSTSAKTCYFSLTLSSMTCWQ